MVLARNVLRNQHFFGIWIHLLSGCEWNILYPGAKRCTGELLVVQLR